MPDPIMTSPLAGSWKLRSLDGVTPPDALHQPVTLEFTEAGVGGFSGVNRFRVGADIDVENGALGFGVGMSTMMAGPPEAMDLEQRFMAALGAVDSYAFKGDLLLLSADGSIRLEFQRLETP